MLEVNAFSWRGPTPEIRRPLLADLEAIQAATRLGGTDVIRGLVLLSPGVTRAALEACDGNVDDLGHLPLACLSLACLRAYFLTVAGTEATLETVQAFFTERHQ